MRALRTSSKGVVERLQVAGLGLLMLAVLSVPAYTVLLAWVDQRQMIADWTISGPPCPAGDGSAYVSSRAPKTFTYGDIAFTRQYGHASCVAWREAGGREPYRVCQFNAPAMLAVETPDGRKTAWRPGVGRRATVAVRDGQATCVLAGWFND